MNTEWLKLHVKPILRDRFIQKWYADLASTSRGNFYLSFKQEFFIEPYLLRLKPFHRMYITQLRLSNFRFPIEIGRWRNIPRNDRECNKCRSGLIGDEYHYLFVCPCQDIVKFRDRYPKVLYQ